MSTNALIPGIPEELAQECLVRVSYSLFGTMSSVSKLWKQEIQSEHYHRIRKSGKRDSLLVAFVQAEPADASAGPSHKYTASASTPSYKLSLLHLRAPSATWHALPRVPGGQGGLPIFCQIAAAGTKLVVLGGWDPETWAPTDGVHVYDFLSGTWRCGARMPGPHRTFFACASSGSAVFVAGGHDAEKDALRSAMRYDVAADEWAPLPDMEKERDECKGAFLNGRFHVIGGYPTEGQGQFGNCAEAFDVHTWEWGPVEEGRLEYATCPRTCVGDAEDGELYMVRGGHVAVEEGGRWKEVAEVPEDATVGTQLAPWAGKLILIGSGSHWGAQAGYWLDISKGGDGNNMNTWQRLEVPNEYSGHVHAACCLEI